MPHFGLVGPSYALDSKNADCQRCMNWYVEMIESGTGKSRARLARTPGLKVFATPTSAASAGIASVQVSRLGSQVQRLRSLRLVGGDALTPTSVAVSPGQLAQSGLGQQWHSFGGDAWKISSIAVTDPGIYNTNRQPTVTITGDGMGAAAYAVMDTLDGLWYVSSIIVTSKGTGYSWANVAITGGSPQGPLTVATATAIISSVSDSLSVPVATYLAGGQLSNNLDLSDFGLVLPPGSTIQGIQLDVAKGASARMSDVLVCLLMDGAVIGDNRAQGAWIGNSSYGGASDLWGATLSTDSLSRLGIRFACANIDDGPAIQMAELISLSLTVYYTPAVPDKLIVETQGAHGYAVNQSLTFQAVDFYSGMNGFDASITELVDDTHFAIQSEYLGPRAIIGGGWWPGKISSPVPMASVSHAQYSASSHRLLLTVSSTTGFWVGQKAILNGAAEAPLLNGIKANIVQIGDGKIVLGWDAAGDYSVDLASATVTTTSDSYLYDAAPVANTGTIADLVPAYARITCSSSPQPFSVGSSVTFSGLTTNAWLNGTSGAISRVPTPGQIDVPVVHIDFADTPDTGVVSLGDVSEYPRVRESIEVAGRVFFVIASFLYEVFSDGSYKSRGTLLDDTQPVSMAASSRHLSIASGGQLYVYDLSTNALAAVSEPGGDPINDVSEALYCDGYFLALVKNSSPAQFRWTDIMDETSWPADNKAAISVFPDSSVSMKFDHREIVFKCRTKSVVYTNTGDANQPFQPVPGSYIDQGEIAPRASVRLDNSTFWIGQDDRGDGIGYRLQGYTPQRITNHAIEMEWQSYGDISDAVGYGFQMNGHSFWHLYFPTANKSWRYDVATGLWHEVGFWTGSAFEAHRSQSHVFAFGKHLVGDWKTGNIYEMSSEFWDDIGTPTRRMRRAPHISREGGYLFFNRLDLEGEFGDVTITEIDGTERAPQIMLRWSDDDGNSWSNEHWNPAGKLGEFGLRVFWTRLGRCWGQRGRVFELVVSDPAPWSITEAYLS